MVTPSDTNVHPVAPAGTESASVSTLVRAEPSQCYVVAIDIESYPEWAQSISAVEVLEYDDEGRVAAARFSAEAVGDAPSTSSSTTTARRRTACRGASDRAI